MSVLDETLGFGGYFIVTCNECHQIKRCGSDRERDLWQRNHAHQEDPA